MKYKKILVKDLLQLIPAEKEVTIQFFAYGIHWGWSSDSGKTCGELKENMIYDCLNAQVGLVTVKNDCIFIIAELVHK